MRIHIENNTFDDAELMDITKPFGMKAFRVWIANISFDAKAGMRFQLNTEKMWLLGFITIVYKDKDSLILVLNNVDFGLRG